MTVIVLSKDEAAEALKKFQFDFLISINESELSRVEGFDSFKGPKISLSFYDIEQELPGLNGPGTFEIESLLSFIKKQDIKEDSSVLIHCKAGISRSSAAAIILCNHLYNDPDKAVDKVIADIKVSIAHHMRLHDYIRPNRKMIYLAELLDEKKGLLDKVASTFEYSAKFDKKEVENLVDRAYPEVYFE